MEKFVTITPTRIRLTGEPGTELNQTVTIVPEKKYPFKILSHRATQGENITYTIEEIKDKNTESYKIVIKNKKPDRGRYSDKIVLTTDSKIQPEMVIYIYGNIFEKPNKQQNVPAKPQPKG